MKATRRNVLVILGVLTIAGGALFGTGAFSQVSADRSVQVDVAEDSQALLGLNASSQYVSQDGDGAIEINLNSTALDNAAGVNVDANTTINGAFQIENNAQAGQTVDLTGTPWMLSSDDGQTTIYLDPGTTSLTNNGDTTPVDITIDTHGATASSALSDIDGQITINATTS